jgi:rhodanese-related sulfurtransferase
MPAPVVIDLDRNDVKAALSSGNGTIIDVREPAEFAAGHIPGSVNMPLSQFDPRALPEGRVILSCAAGIRSERAALLAQAAGRDVREHYKGGFKDWVGAGETVEW